MIKKYLLLSLLVTCQQSLLAQSSEKSTAVTKPKVFVSNINDSTETLPLPQTLVGNGLSSDLTKLWAQAELLPINDEDFPLAFQSPSSTSSGSSKLVKESNDNLVTDKSINDKQLSSLLPDDINPSDVLKRVGWAGDQSRYAVADNSNKGWSKQINVGQSMGPSMDKPGPSSIQSINNQQSDEMKSSLMSPSPMGQPMGPMNMDMVDLTAAATSNNYEISSTGSGSSGDSSSSSSGSGSNEGSNEGRYSSYNSDSHRPRTRYGFRVTSSRHREPEFSPSSNYDDFAPPDYPPSSPGSSSDSSYGDSYESGPPPPPPSPSSSSGSSAEEYRERIPGNDRHGPSHDMKHSDGPPPPPPPSSSSSPSHPPHDSWERDVPPRSKYSGYRPRYRAKQHFMSSSASLWPEFSEWESPSSSDRGWLSSLFSNGGSGAGYKSTRPTRYRSPFALTSSVESIPYTSLPSNFFDDAIPYYKPIAGHHHPHSHIPPVPSAPIHSPIPSPRPSTWFNWAGTGLRPHASTIRPSYSFGSFGYAPSYAPRPLMSTMSPGHPPPPQSPYGYSYGALPSSSSMMPVSVRSPFTFGSMMTSPSMSYPFKVAYTPSPYTLAFRSPYPMYRPFIPSTDLAFAESFRKPNTSEKMEGSASQSAMAFASPPSPSLQQQQQQHSHQPPPPPQQQQQPTPSHPHPFGPNSLFNPLASFVNRPGSNGFIDPFNFFNHNSMNVATEKPTNSESQASSSSSSSASSTESTTASPAAKKNTGILSGLRKIF